MASRDQVIECLKSNGYVLGQEKRLTNDTGWQLRTETGQIVNVFDNGNFYVQGKNPENLRAKLASALSMPESAPSMSRRVFVVYGHDAAARTELEAMLRRWDVEPLILDQLPSKGMTLIEKLEEYQGDVPYAVVLATPDDEGHRTGQPSEKALRARQNVVLELGMMLAILGRSRVAILLKDKDNMERPSDIQGLIYIPFKDNVHDAALTLAKEMDAQGLKVDVGRI